jgi:hypothetical protein
MQLTKKIPTVIVSNFAEAHFDFLGRCADPVERHELILSEAYHADRTLLWGGDPKLVIVSYPIAHADLVRQRLDFLGTEHAFPETPTYLLCKDILRETPLLEKIARFAGENRAIDLIPYATTPEFLELAGFLRSNYNLDVRTPESPEPKDFWLRDYVDTKNGFRSLASMWLDNAEDFLTLGFSCYNMDHAIKVVDWFCQQNEACVVKADTGESGIGTVVIKPYKDEDRDRVLNRLREDPYFDDELIVVERYIPSAEQISPSLEIKVPRLGDGLPEVTYVSGQLFLNFGDFCGIQIDKSLYQSSWYPRLESSGLSLASRLQQMGYVGHFDMDCVVRDDGHLFLLEINARRTGGTHVHEFARHFYGADYIEKASFISYEAMDSGSIVEPQELLDVLDDYLLPIRGDKRHGLVITITRALHNHRFGCIFVAPTVDLALSLQQDVQRHLKEYSKKKL